MRTLLTLTSILAAATYAAAFPRYVVTDLGDLPGGADLSRAMDSNEAGYVVVTGTSAVGESAFVWSRAGGRVPLPGLPGRPQTIVFSINEHGVISGAAHDGTWPTGYRPVLWTTSGQVTELTLPSGVDWAFQGHLSDQGMLVTWGGTPSGRRGLIWRAGSGWEVVAPPAGYSECGLSSVNNKGEVCGWADNDPFLYINGAWIPLDVPAGGLDAYPNFITDEGRSGGYVRVGSSLWIAGQWNRDGDFIQSPQYPGSNSMDCFTASAEGGLVSGSTFDGGFGTATLWSPVDGVVSVNSLLDPSTLGWHLNAMFIEPDRTMIGWGQTNGVEHACAAVPVGNPISMNVLFGRHSAGNLENMAEADGYSLDVCKFIVPNQTVAPVTVEFDGSCALTKPFAYLLRATSSTSVAGSFEQTTDLFDWQSGDYGSGDSRTDALGTAWKTVELAGSGNLARYVGPGQSMRARFRIKPNGPVSGSAWCVRFDRVEFVAQL
ncbi:MAG: hypothetical protein IT207_11570 [Fimbriimonadaceae bacterium]|nr:hypothetical protein [Fimbriimonadaceae bacterium]